MSENYYFELGHDSFGEIYHVGMHGILIPKKEHKHFGVLVYEPHKKSIYDFFDDIAINYIVDRDCQKRGLSETANTIFNNFHRDTVKMTQNQILTIATERDWKFHLPDLATPDPKILIWQRNDPYESHRNSSISLLRQLSEMAIKHEVIPVIIGPDRNIKGTHPLPDFYKHPFFHGGHSVCKQLWFQHMLFTKFGVKASVGMMSGAMDGAAMFFGHKTIFFAKKQDATPRMAKVATAIPSLHWLKTEYDELLAKLNERQLNELEEIIWPLS